MPRVATTAKWPTALAVLGDVGLFTNREDADLVQDETDATTLFRFDDASAIAVGMLLSSVSENGFEIVRVTAVDLALNTATVVRGRDGTVGVAHLQGQTWKVVPTAQGLNQIRDDLFALEAAIGTPSTPGTGLPSLFPLADNTYSLGSASRRWKDIYVAAASLHVVAASGDANDLYRLGTAGLSGGAGGASALDVFLARQASSVFESTGLLAGSFRFGQSGAGTSFWALRAAAADANAYLQGTTAGIAWGLGGATAVDAALGRQAASVVELTGSLAGSIRYGMSGAALPFLGLRAAAADAQPLVALLTDRIAIGAGGASAADYSLVRTGANTGTLSGTLRPSTDASYDVGSTVLRWANAYSNVFAVYGAASDANAVWSASSAGVRYGPGGGTATDILVARQAASVLEATGSLAGSVRYGLSGAATPFVELRVAAANAQPDSQLLKDRLNFGPGGAGAIDASLVRLLAATLGGPSDAGLSLGSAATRLLNVVANVHDVYGAAADANPVLRASSAGIAFGVGGATATDILVARQAAAVLEHTGSLAGSLRWGMSGAATPFLALRAAAADANALVSLTSTGLSIGAGGASAVDVTFLRTGANAATLTATAGLTHAGNILADADNTRNIGATGANFANLYLKRTAGSVLFMGADGLVTESNATLFFDSGSTFLGIGTAVPSAFVHAKFANVAANVGMTAENSDNTSLTSHAIFEASVGGAAGGDPLIKYTVQGATNFVHGIDNSDSDRWKLSFGAALGTGDLITAASAALGFYGVAPVARPAAYTQTYATATKTHSNPTATVLTDNTAGTADTTLEALNDIYMASEHRANFADLAAAVNALIVDLANVKQVLNSVIDDDQILGLKQ